DLSYHIDDYPGALEAIRCSLVVGYPAQAVLANPEVVDAYLAASVAELTLNEFMAGQWLVLEFDYGQALCPEHLLECLVRLIH
ncbi:hypothetical protein, partial [Bradyrhizobium uaiense]|uniref:hypothetical protein n=1 Tax=Bradyrhizobium uaiense TaxID=2594946 RepID=UPI0013D5F6B0